MYRPHREVVLEVIRKALAGPPDAAALALVQGLDDAGRYLNLGRLSRETMASAIVAPTIYQTKELHPHAGDEELAWRIAEALDADGHMRSWEPRPRAPQVARGVDADPWGED